MATQTVKITSVEDYIDSQTEDKKAILEKLRQLVKKQVPAAEEVISYGMPAFKYHGMLLWYAAFKEHYSIFPYNSTIEAFKPQLKSYKLSKGTIQFPLDKPVPVKLITDIIKYRVKDNLDKEKAKQAAKKTKKK